MRRVVIFSGTRSLSFPVATLYRVMREYDRRDTLIIHGDASGVDLQTDTMAKQMGYQRVRVPANWNGYGDSAGPKRNVFMLDVARALVQSGMYDAIEVCAFHPNIEESKGTRHMVKIARREGVMVRVFSE